MDNLVDRQARAINFSALGRDFQLITMTVVISNLVTLTLISIDSSAQLAISAVVITTLLFSLIAGLNQIDTFKAFTFDMDAEEEKTNVGQQGKNAPFGMWKSVYSLSFIVVALAQLYELWV